MIHASRGHHDFSVTQTAVITVSRTVSPFKQPRSASLELSLFPSVQQMAGFGTKLSPHQPIAASSRKRRPVWWKSQRGERRMSDQHLESAAPVEPNFDRTPQPFGDGPADPLVYDASPRALRQRTVNFAAKRLVDMRYVGRLDRATTEWHFRWRPAGAPGGFAFRAAPDGQLELAAAQRRGDIVVEMDDADRRVTVRWSDAGFGEPVVGAFRRHRRQFDCVRCRLRDVARLCQARGAVSAERDVGGRDRLSDGVVQRR
jgi:hypothetical protein